VRADHVSHGRRVHVSLKDMRWRESLANRKMMVNQESDSKSKYSEDDGLSSS
jgi:hypothetical protein